MDSWGNVAKLPILGQTKGRPNDNVGTNLRH
ncbi:MAG: hypothetical protein ACI9FB_001187 [Candidatus Azotimanducaceae bacterium]|jgi:hypothetical protein